LLTAIYLRRGERTLETSAFHCLWLGWLGALLALASGTFDAVRQLFDVARPRDDALAWINTHALVGAAIVVIYWQAWQIRRRNPTILDESGVRRGYLARLSLGVVLIVVDGWLGGHLVYSLRLGVNP